MSNLHSGAVASGQFRHAALGPMTPDLAAIFFHRDFKSWAASQFSKLQLQEHLIGPLMDLAREMNYSGTEDVDHTATLVELAKQPSPLDELIAPKARAAMVREIARHDGLEVLFAGSCNKRGVVTSVRALAFGSRRAVPAAISGIVAGEVLIHNHPGGRMEPSDQDIELSAAICNRGCASYIVSNAVNQARVIVPRASVRSRGRRGAPVADQDPLDVLGYGEDYAITAADLPKEMDVTEEEALLILRRRRALAAARRAK